MWIYTYIRSDREEIDMGPYQSREEANRNRLKHDSFGALTMGPFEKADDYQLYKGPDLDSLLRLDQA